MSPHEKQARLNLAVIGIAIVAYLALLPFLGAYRATGAFGLLGLLGVVPFIGRGKKVFGVDVADERDSQVQVNAQLIAYTTFWIVFVGGTMSLWSAFRQQGTMPVDILPLFPLIGFLVVVLSRSIAVVVQYQNGK